VIRKPLVLIVCALGGLLACGCAEHEAKLKREQRLENVRRWLSDIEDLLPLVRKAEITGEPIELAGPPPCFRIDEGDEGDEPDNRAWNAGVLLVDDLEFLRQRRKNCDAKHALEGSDDEILRHPAKFAVEACEEAYYRLMPTDAGILVDGEPPLDNRIDQLRYVVVVRITGVQEGGVDCVEQRGTVIVGQFTHRDAITGPGIYNSGWLKAEAILFDLDGKRCLGGFAFQVRNSPEISYGHTPHTDSGKPVTQEDSLKAALTRDLYENARKELWRQLRERIPGAVTPEPDEPVDEQQPDEPNSER